MSFSDKISSVGDWIQKVDVYANADVKSENRHLRVWFRGQAQSEWKLQPKIYRQLKEGLHDDELKTALKELWGQEAHINREFQSWSSNLVSFEPKPIECYFLQQHYGVPTRFLDWTRNALVALYFATEEKANGIGDEPDGKVFSMDAYRFGIETVKFRRSPSKDEESVTIQGFSAPGYPVFEPIAAQLYYWQDYDFPAPVFPVFPRFLDQRMQIQRSTFTYHSPQHRLLTENRNTSLREYIIDGCHKKEIRKQLTHLGIDEFFIFGDLPSLARTIMSDHGFDNSPRV